MKTDDANLKKNKHSGIICNCNLQQFEIICYEAIDILEAPRLVNNPFAYAYTNNPFCGKDFPPMNPELVVVLFQILLGQESLHQVHLTFLLKNVISQILFSKQLSQEKCPSIPEDEQEKQG
ncbi:uncharacterized protein TNCV_2216021 [Trichonephila clavipes]|nr:uncharacterized protein TNCV_2216021 [Trichonephila clavipes]